MRMRWTIGIVTLIVLLLAAYTAWPLVALYRLGSAVERRNVIAVARMIDLAPLRLSLAQQIMSEYLRLAGKSPRGGSLAISFGATIADSIVEQLVIVDNLADLLRTGTIDAIGPSRLSADFAPLNAAALSSAWRIWLGSEYSGTRFQVSLPADRPVAQQFGIRLHVRNWRWRLTG